MGNPHKDKIMELSRNGLKPSEICKQLNLRPGQVAGVLRRERKKAIDAAAQRALDQALEETNGISKRA